MHWIKNIFQINETKSILVMQSRIPNEGKLSAYSFFFFLWDESGSDQMLWELRRSKEGDLLTITAIIYLLLLIKKYCFRV